MFFCAGVVPGALVKWFTSKERPYFLICRTCRVRSWVFMCTHFGVWIVVYVCLYIEFDPDLHMLAWRRLLTFCHSPESVPPKENTATCYQSWPLWDHQPRLGCFQSRAGNRKKIPLEKKLSEYSPLVPIICYVIPNLLCFYQKDLASFGDYFNHNFMLFKTHILCFAFKKYSVEV